jgi:predicted amidophosphoribosyltransferase
MQCSATQLGNVLAAFRLRNGDVASNPMTRLAVSIGSLLGRKASLRPQPVLLVDDVIDSGWTLTWAAVLLRAHGSGPVHPLALAKASPRGK